MDLEKGNYLFEENLREKVISALCSQQESGKSEAPACSMLSDKKSEADSYKHTNRTVRQTGRQVDLKVGTVHPMVRGFNLP